MAPRNLSDLFRALLALVRKEIAEWKRAIGWAVFHISAVVAATRNFANLKQTVTETV